MEINLRKHKTKRPTKNAKGRKMAVKGVSILFVALLALSLVCSPILAAPGGTYRIEEVGMTLEIPQGWSVITRDTSPGDPDLARHGGYDAAMDDLKEGKFYLLAMHESQGFITLQIIDDVGRFEDIDNLTEEYLQASESEKQSLADIAQRYLVGEYGEFQGAYYSDDVNKVNNYVYLRFSFNLSNTTTDEMITVINGKTVFFDAFPVHGSTMTEAERNYYYQILSTVRYDNMLTIEQVMAGEGQSKSSGAAIWLVVLGALAVAAVVIVVLLRRKKQIPPPASGGYVPPVQTPSAPSIEPEATSNVPEEAAVQTPPSDGGYVPPVQTSNIEPGEPLETPNVAPVQPLNAEPVEPLSVEAVQEAAGPEVQTAQSAPQGGGSVFCRMCGAKLEADSVFCTKCGVRVE